MTGMPLTWYGVLVCLLKLTMRHEALEHGHLTSDETAPAAAPFFNASTDEAAAWQAHRTLGATRKAVPAESSARTARRDAATAPGPKAPSRTRRDDQ